MSVVKSNPYVYIFPAIIFGAVFLYYLYGAIDRLGLEARTVAATVTGKTFTQGSTTYVNNVAGGRSWVQAQKQSGFYAVSLVIGKEPTVALVSKEKFDILQKNDQVKVKVRRTRISRRIEVIKLNINN